MKKLGVVLATVLTVCGYAAAATLPGTVDMSRRVAGLGEVSPGVLGFAVTLTITAAPDIAETVTALAVEETLPDGWSYLGVSGSPMPMERLEGSLLQLFWIDTPDMTAPVVLEYYLEAPAALAGATITGKVLYRTNGGPLESPEVVTPPNEINCLFMTRSASLPGYIPGEEITFTVTVNSFCFEPVTALAVVEDCPAGWTFVSASGSSGIAPVPGTGGPFEFAWLSIPAIPHTFTYTVAVPGGYSDAAVVSGQVISRLSGPELRSPFVDTLLTFMDTVPPVIAINGDSPVTVECGGVYTELGATATDNVDSVVDVTVDNSAVNTASPGDYTVYYTAQDSAGNSAQETRTVQVVDTTAPAVFIDGGVAQSGACGVPLTLHTATAADTCGGSVPATVADLGGLNPASPAVGVYEVLFEAFDGAGNRGTATLTVTITDTQVPLLVLDGANPLTVECGAVFSDPGATATDSCAGNLTAAIVVEGTVNTAIPGLYLLTYTVQDPSGNVASLARDVEVADTTPPVIALQGPSTVTLTQGTPYTEPGYTATDTCSGDLTAEVGVTGSVNVTVPGAYELTYAVSDGAGNPAQTTRTVNVISGSAPVITILGQDPAFVECGGTYEDAGAEAADAEDGDLTPLITVENLVNTAATGVYHVFYTVTDAAMNTVTADRTVVVGDTTAPVLSLQGDDPLVVECGYGFNDPGATAMDACLGNLDAAIAVYSEVDAATPGTYPVVYTVSDAAGNESVAFRGVEVVDTVGPMIFLQGDNPMQLECGTPFVEPGVIGSDACSGEVPVESTAALEDFGAVGTVAVLYIAQDGAGNSTTVTRTVNVVDTTPPVLSLIGGDLVVLPVGSPWVDPGSTAVDVCAGDITVGVSVTGAVNTAVPGDYPLTYVSNDGAGNTSSVVRVVRVTPGAPPVITLLGDNPMTVECGAAFQDPGATASDAEDGDLTGNITVAGSVNTAVPGTYQVSYAVTDSDGGSALEARSVVVADTLAPTVTLLGANPATVALGTPYTEPGFTATDACAGDLTGSVAVAGTVDTATTGTYVLTYTAQDPAGNTASATRTVLVGGTGYCDLTDVDILRPAGNVLVPLSTSTAAVPLRSRPVFSSADCVTGSVSVEYLVDGVSRGVSTDAAGDYPLTVALGTGRYELTALATQLETGAVVTSVRTFSVIGAQINPFGYLNDPFPSLPEDGDTFENTLAGGGYYRVITMASAYCAPEAGVAADVVVGAAYPDRPGQSVTVRVPRAAIPCGYQAIIILTLSDSVEGLVGFDQAPLMADPPEGLVQGGLFFDVSVIVASQEDVLAGGEIPYAELDNAWFAASPVTFTLNGLSFVPGRVPVFLSHPTDIQPLGDADVNLFATEGVWSDANTGGFMVQGDTLTGSATALSVFAPFERRATLAFSPNVAYGVVFGRAVLEKTLERTFVVTNVGDLPVSGGAVIAGDAAFTVVGEAAYTLQPGQSAEITVAFTPTEIRDYEAQLQLTGDPEGLHSARLLGSGTKGRTNLFGCGPGSAAGGGDWAVLLAACALLMLGRGLRGVAGRAR